MSRRSTFKASLLLAAFSLVLAACGDDLGDVETIKLAVNPWDGSAVNIAVAAAVLEGEGYTVERVEIDENAQWAAIAAGDLHASLEVWPSGHADNVASYIDGGGGVVNGGELGAVGKIGWWIPTYVVDQNPAAGTWQGLQDPATAQVYATAETGDKGQFLIGDPSWVSYEQDIIDNLGLHLEVAYAGSEEALLAAMDSATSRGDPLLFYWWTPHSAFSKFDLTAFELPAYSDECYASGAVDCDYPDDVLFKIMWDGLEEGAPTAFTILSNFSYTNEDQIFMLGKLDEGLSVDEAAAAWMDANESVWQAWIPG
nr:hypothetical protein [bacterium]MDE0501742.1 hypothetical protein [bacterium]